jgi:3-hydroxybutyryl-CoA dehydrogenase
MKSDTEAPRVAVLGTGLMGSLIALVYARAGSQIAMYDLNENNLRQAASRASQALEQLRAGGLETRDQASILARMKTTRSLGEAVAEAQVIVEVIVENVAAKIDLYQKVETLCAPTALITSNTSGLQPSMLSQHMTHPERFMVTHFWNPPHLIPLVEVVPSPKTSSAAVSAAFDLLKRIGQRPVLVRQEIAGFIGNRLQYALLREALALVQSGVATPEEIDDVVTSSFGPRLATVGPLMSADLGGLHTFAAVARQLFPDLASGTEPLKPLTERVERNELGASTGRGFYSWSPERVSTTVAERDGLLLHLLRSGRLDR